MTQNSERQIKEIWEFLYYKNQSTRRLRVQKFILTLSIINVILIGWWRVIVPYYIGTGETISGIRERLQEITPEQFKNKKQRKVKEGEDIIGYKVTSGFYECRNPRITKIDCRNLFGNHEPHKGIDIATPTGKVLYAVGDREKGKTKVTCNFQKNLAGLYAEISPPDSKYKFQALHLSKCDSGEYIPGQIFAATGGDKNSKNAGRSTGPHLDFRQLEYKSTKRKSQPKKIPPEFSWTYQLLAGEKTY